MLALLLVFTACGESATETATKTEEAKPKKKERLKIANKPGGPAVNKDNSASGKAGFVNWIDIADLEKANAKNKRKVIVDLYTDWCGWCKRMDKATFQNAEIAELINENFHAVKFNAESKNEISFKGAPHKFVPAGRRGVNELAYKFLNGRMSYPTIAFLDENLERINAFPGFKKPDQMEPLLAYIDGGHYKQKSLSQFQQTFKSTIK